MMLIPVSYTHLRAHETSRRQRQMCIRDSVNPVIFKDELSQIKSQASHFSYEGLQDILNSIDKVKIRLKANVNFDLVIELLIMAIKQAV